MAMSLSSTITRDMCHIWSHVSNRKKKKTFYYSHFFMIGVITDKTYEYIFKSI